MHPNFYAYFPCGNSYPNILADMLSTAFGGVGFSWVRISFHFVLLSLSKLKRTPKKVATCSVFSIHAMLQSFSNWFFPFFLIQTSQPSLTELENVMMDWMGRALNLPKFFLFEDSKGVGGGWWVQIEMKILRSEKNFFTPLLTVQPRLDQIRSFAQWWRLDSVLYFSRAVIKNHQSIQAKFYQS